MLGTSGSGGRRKGRAGVGILSRQAPLAVRTGIDVEEFARAGRCIEADFAVDGKLREPVRVILTVASLYLPWGK
ncbi:MAG: hypothetical protein U1U88_001916 [Lawsonella clevelandensis]